MFHPRIGEHVFPPVTSSRADLRGKGTSNNENVFSGITVNSHAKYLSPEARGRTKRKRRVNIRRTRWNCVLFSLGDSKGDVARTRELRRCSRETVCVCADSTGVSLPGCGKEGGQERKTDGDSAVRVESASFCTRWIERNRDQPARVATRTLCSFGST